MPIALTCPKCHAPQTVPDEDAGRFFLQAGPRRFAVRA